MFCQIGFARTGAAGSERGMEQAEEVDMARSRVRPTGKVRRWIRRLPQTDQPFSPLRATPRTI